MFTPSTIILIIPPLPKRTGIITMKLFGSLIILLLISFNACSINLPQPNTQVSPIEPIAQTKEIVTLHSAEQLPQTNQLNPFELLEKVNGFYNNAFNSLITIVACIIGFAGVLLPIAIAFFQNRQFKIQKADLEKNLKEVIKEEIAATALALEEKTNQLIDTEIKKILFDLEKKSKSFEANIKKSQYLISGQLAHMNATLQLDKKAYSNAATYFFSAATHYISARSEQNLGRVLRLLHEKALPNMKIERKIEEADEKIVKLKEKIKPLNTTGKYRDDLAKINRSLEKAQNNLANKKEEV